MAGRIGPVHQSEDGRSYGFLVYDDANRACAYLGFNTWHEADRAARLAQALWAAAVTCARR
jgi:hypothetical protein